MSSKISMLRIIKDHVGTLYNVNTGKKGRDCTLFFGLPLLVAGLLTALSPIMPDGVITLIATVFSIFTALLLSLLLLLFDMGKKIADKKSNHVSDSEENIDLTKKVNKLVTETKSNISFLIFVAIISLFLMILLSIVSGGNCYSLIQEYHNEFSQNVMMVLSAISYYLLSLFGITLLMVLKRIYSLLSELLGNNSE